MFKNRKKIYMDVIEEKGLTNNIDLSILDELCRVMKRIYIYIWCNKSQIGQYFDFFEQKRCQNEILIWNKTNPCPTCNNHYLNDKEYCLMFREKDTELNGSLATKRTVYTTPINVSDKKKYNHPTIKPLMIIKNLIVNSSKNGDIVLDCIKEYFRNKVKELGWIDE